MTCSYETLPAVLFFNAVYFSRSRQKLWRKGEESGHVQKVQRILVDCDQDCLILKVTVDQGQCHVGYQSCFYRAIKPSSANQLEFTAKKVYDPAEAYNVAETHPEIAAGLDRRLEEWRTAFRANPRGWRPRQTEPEPPAPIAGE